MSKCFKCGRDLGPKEEYMKMATQNGKICYICYNKYAAEERNINREKFKIDSYSFGKIVIDGTIYTSDVIILGDRVIPNWWRKEGHNLCIDDLKQVASHKPEVLIIGTGASGMMKVPKEVIDYLAKLEIKTIEDKTDEACMIYNKLCDRQDISAVLHLTC